MKKTIITSLIILLSFGGFTQSLHLTGADGNGYLSGNFGIGTSTFLPGEKLAITTNGGSRFGIYPGYLDGVANSNWTTLDIPFTGNLRVWDNFSVDGNVGIGTTSPGAKLEVAGGDALINGLTAGRGNGNNPSNTTLGGSALVSNTTGSSNTAIGQSALLLNTTGNENTANGMWTLLNNTTGSQNAAAGAYALFSNTTGNFNSASGYGALSNSLTGNYNTANGAYALQYNTTGNDNTAAGVSALQSNTVGFENTAIGRDALFANTTGTYNTASGRSALTLNTTGGANTANGVNALRNNLTGSNNTAVGFQSLQNNSNNWNTALGANSLFSNTTGGGNTGLGAAALAANAVGEWNVAVGFQSLANNNANGNSALGYNALINNTTGNFNVAIGLEALINNVTSGGNTAVGARALYNAAAATEENTAVGFQAGFQTTSGTHNVIVGRDAFYNNTSGSGNTAIGFAALVANTTGTGNTAIGSNANFASGALNNATAIGANTMVSQSNSLVLGNNADVGIGTGAPSAKLHVVGDVIIADGTQGAGKVLTSDANGLASWAAGPAGGATTVNAISGTSNANGATISGGALTLTPASSANGGVVTSGTQTFGGPKTFSDDAVINGVIIGRGYGNSDLNTAAGAFALAANTSGSSNSAIAYGTLYNNTTGSNNTGLGRLSLFLNTTGFGNTGTGLQSLYYNTTGANNTAMGFNALITNTTGGQNTALGVGADVSSGNLYNATAIGAMAMVSTSHSLVLGSIAGINGASSSTKVGIGVTNPALTLDVESIAPGGFVAQIQNNANSINSSALELMAGTNVSPGATEYHILFNRPDGFALGAVKRNNSTSMVYLTSSDRRLKTNIQDTRFGLADLNKIEVKDYLFIGGDQEQNGYIAQQLFEIYPDAVSVGGEDAKANPWMVDYGRLSPLLVKSIQELSTMNDAKDESIKELQSAVDNLQSRVFDQQAVNDELRSQINSMNDCIQSLCSDQSKSAGVMETSKSLLFQNQPNPFNLSTVIRYKLAEGSDNGSIVVRDLNGRIVRTLTIGSSATGQVTLNANELVPGTYTYTLVVNNESIDTKLMVVTR